MNFKVGDKVVWINDSTEWFTEGKEYVVAYSFVEGGEEYIKVESNSGVIITRLSRRFKHAEGVKEQPKQYFAVDVQRTLLEHGKGYIPTAEKPASVLINGIWYKRSRFSEVKPEEKEPEWKSLLRKLREKVGANAGTCSYAMIDTNGVECFQVKDACHARMIDGYNVRKYNVCVLDVKGHYDTHPNKEEFKTYVDYIVHRSPWKNAFITRTTDEVVNEGIAINVDNGVNYVVSAAVALRIGHEYPNLAVDFHNLVVTGCPEHLAFITSSMMNGYNLKEYPLKGHHGSHHVMCGHQGVAAIKSFFNEGKCNKGAPYTGASDYKILGCIGEHAADPISSLLAKYPKITTKNGVWGDEKSIARDPKYGLAPLAFFLAKELL